MSSEDRVEFFQHALGDEEKARILDALDGTILTTGEPVAKAERALADYLDTKQVVCLDSCTAALHLALLALDVGPGDEVVVPAMTFIATANAVLMAGATPIFADVDPSTGCLTVETVSAKISERTRAIIPVHLYGQLCDMESFSALAKSRNLRLIEDSAHCLEARRDAVRPGSHSDAACFSFYATKAITCGEGGALATNNAALAERVRVLSLHGMTSSVADRYGKPYRQWDMVELGWKYNLDNIRGSLLLPQIRKLDVHCRQRREICEFYAAAFCDIDEIDWPTVECESWSARHLFPIWVNASWRDKMIVELERRGIGIVVNYRPVHLLTYYARRFGFGRGDLPVAERIGDRTLCLPLFPQMTEAQMERVTEAVVDSVRVCARQEQSVAVTGTPLQREKIDR
ncbi:MAG: DegT/DnrJ/EryC1/StrS family aminotransferase [Planctomycetes bacterium]|nr:DegT/DnrJ/EryC1/StrS family aminotransferase [Planctomycetota bacterium]